MTCLDISSFDMSHLRSYRCCIKGSNELAYAADYCQYQCCLVFHLCTAFFDWIAEDYHQLFACVCLIQISIFFLTYIYTSMVW